MEFWIPVYFSHVWTFQVNQVSEKNQAVAPGRLITFRLLFFWVCVSSHRPQMLSLRDDYPWERAVPAEAHRQDDSWRRIVCYWAQLKGLNQVSGPKFGAQDRRRMSTWHDVWKAV